MVCAANCGLHKSKCIIFLQFQASPCEFIWAFIFAYVLHCEPKILHTWSPQWELSCYDYSVQEANDKPSPVWPQVISSRGARLSETCKFLNANVLVQSSTLHQHLFVSLRIAVQMWNLAINLPLMIGSKIPVDDEHWECFLLLLDILQLCTTRVASAGQAGYLEALSHDHHHL